MDPFCQELPCLPMGIIYFITIPSMYLLLVIYSVFNLNNVSWGTREVPKTAAELELEKQQAQKDAELKVIKRKKSNSLFNLFSRGSDAEFSLSGRFRKSQDQQDDLKAELKEINAKLERLENAVGGDAKTSKVEAKAPVMKPQIPEKPVKRSMTVRIQEPEEVRDELRNPFWIEQDEHIGDGPRRYLKKKEVLFWMEMIDKYLKPLDKDREKEKKDAQGLLDLRNQAVFSFLMINAIWVVSLYLMQKNKDKLSVT